MDLINLNNSSNSKKRQNNYSAKYH